MMMMRCALQRYINGTRCWWARNPICFSQKGGEKGGWFLWVERSTIMRLIRVVDPDATSGRAWHTQSLFFFSEFLCIQYYDRPALVICIRISRIRHGNTTVHERKCKRTCVTRIIWLRATFARGRRCHRTKSNWNGPPPKPTCAWHGAVATLRLSSSVARSFLAVRGQQLCIKDQSESIRARAPRGIRRRRRLCCAAAVYTHTNTAELTVFHEKTREIGETNTAKNGRTIVSGVRRERRSASRTCCGLGFLGS